MAVGEDETGEGTMTFYGMLAFAALGTLLVLEIYLLLRYAIATHALRKILNSSSGDGRKTVKEIHPRREQT